MYRRYLSHLLSTLTIYHTYITREQRAKITKYESIHDLILMIVVVEFQFQFMDAATEISTQSQR